MSPRTRTRVLVAAAAAVSAAVVVGVTVLQAEDGSAGEPGAARRAPPLELGLLARDDPETRALREAESLLDGGERSSARERFEEILADHPASVEAAVGEAIASWPDGTVDRLSRLVDENPESGVARLHLGLALLASGEEAAAAREWREVERRDPDSPAAVRAEDLLHPQMAPGRPPFVAPFPELPELEGLPPERQLAELERRAEAGGAADWLLLGAAYQRAGRPVSAGEAFLRAAEIEPGSLAAQVAAAVGRFDKDEPSQTFSRLGPLARDHSGAGVVRYHLALSLSWLGDVEEAKRQLRQARGGGFYGREAERLFSRLEAIGP
ncbi:MAG: tetratricopeptide repeat protein [Gaiellaceae bacterium]